MFVGLLLAKAVIVVLGLFVAVQGYRAFRRERSQRMLIVAGGFAFLSIGSVIEGVCYNVFHLSTLLSGAIQTCLTGVGMGLIAVSLFVPGTAATESDEPPDGVPGQVD
ncbi:hypothetical protein BV210_09235 [Halorientalis sp. IM1011]|jgi:hypothetical protein|uniref:DUF7521 family protein n=1 Tax=Halorientalis sp. IM1011 TaxID=1932360 RepID=UPI00097CC449|nr:hypothetical protein [Halorientalis sp. IM1011]AQL42885.1 hypothetical protein BV210_09235 [Halorientalis sp. IM1011]